MLSRRHVNFVLAATLASPAFARTATLSPDPILYRIARGKGLVYLFGFADATDDSWFTSKLRQALDASTTLWLETPPGSGSNAAEGKAGPPPDPELTKLFTERAFDRQHDLFTLLPHDLAQRTLGWAAKLGIKPESLSPMRPWFARITIQQRYAADKQAKAKTGDKLVSPETAIIGRAREKGIGIKTEYPSMTDLIRFFAELPEQAQADYLREILDYIDDDSVGKMDAKYGWITGHPSTISLDRMRERTPALYRAMHIERNAAWAERIRGILGSGGTSFIMIGQNHVLGLDSIQTNLSRLGIRAEEV